MMILIGFDAFQHHNWRQSEILGTLTSYGGGIRGDTPLILIVKDEKQQPDTLGCAEQTDLHHRRTMDDPVCGSRGGAEDT